MVNWSELVFDEASMKAFEKLAIRRFNEGVLAEEAVTHVVEGLSENDWARCKSFQGKSKPTTFIYSMASNLIEEFARQRFGRPRPPSWLQAQGETWVQMWKLLCLERQMLPSVLDRLCMNGERLRESLEDIARTIRARMPNCGLTAMDQETSENIELLSDMQQSDEELDSPGEFGAEEAAASEIMLMLRAVLSDEVQEADFSAQARQEAADLAVVASEGMARLREELTLSDEERLLLRLVFVEGLSKTAASKAIGLPAHQAGRVTNAALERIGTAMRAAGFDLDDLLAKM